MACTASTLSSPGGSADRVLGHARSRLHLEENVVSAFGRTQDNWSWRDRIETDGGVTTAYSNR